MDDGPDWKWLKMDIDLCLTRKEFENLRIFPMAETLDEVIDRIEFDTRYRLISEAHDRDMVCWVNYRDRGRVKWCLLNVVESEPKRDVYDPKNWGIR